MDDRNTADPDVGEDYLFRLVAEWTTDQCAAFGDAVADWIVGLVRAGDLDGHLADLIVNTGSPREYAKLIRVRTATALALGPGQARDYPPPAVHAALSVFPTLDGVSPRSRQIITSLIQGFYVHQGQRS
ncbi:hypothetical protein [Saccharothrix sp.]|uniref:hypothetical protein n=1 Tax=Saccharothrix sp. TaxID=1873460 RepID=UPI002811A9BA|nr:hypothetical protein [Saccharothrix sp.]